MLRETIDKFRTKSNESTTTTTTTATETTIDENGNAGTPRKGKFGPFPENILQKINFKIINKQKDKRLGIRVGRNLNITSIQPGSPAEGILKPGDLIISINGVKSYSRIHIEEQIRIAIDGILKFEIKRPKTPQTLETTSEIMNVLPKAYDRVPGCRYIIAYLCVYPGANLGIHIMSLDSKVYVTNAPQNTLAGEIFNLGDVILSIDNIPVTTVTLCSNHIKDALSTKGWCKVLIERPITPLAKRRTKNALKTEKSLEIDPRLPDDVALICNGILSGPKPSSPINLKGILKDSKATAKSNSKVSISQESEECTIGCDPYNLDLMETVDKPEPARNKNDKKKKRNFFGFSKTVEN